VLRNLLSNALKFTERGKVSLRIARVARAEWTVENDVLNKADAVIAFTVTDTGIGIAKDKQKIIFEAFQQADGSTSRKYGGTGLGLAISREIAGLLGGELHLQSDVGQGSSFTLYLPVHYVQRPRAIPALTARELREAARAEGELAAAARRRASVAAAPALSADGGGSIAEAVLDGPAVTTHTFSDDRGSIQPGDRVLLVVEDDESFGRILLGLARDRGFRAVVAPNGEQGLELARSIKPDAITLDLKLPDMDGWVVLDQLKHDTSTRHIPVHVISAADEERRGLECGAIAFLRKPVEAEALDQALSNIQRFVERRVKQLLIVEDDETQRSAIVELIGNGDVHSMPVASGEEALKELETGNYDCIVLDLKLPGMSGFELIKAIKDRPGLRRVPIIVYTGQELSHHEETELRRLADTIIVKDVRSPERLLDETSLFLHRIESQLPPPKREMLRKVSESDPSLLGRKVLLVDDDARNLFAVTTILEQHAMQVVYAENGREAIEKLSADPGIDVVLMDIMMPEMDGYEATRQIRERPDWRKLPIIALTAKAMKGDREKCIQAGASDYITKPVDPDQLVSLLRVWLYR
jgi:CheY-like chemotaxis protein